MHPRIDFENALDRLDTSLFSRIESQTTEDDRRSLLAVQRAVRSQRDYVYLEIGSHLGGTLQPHLSDPRCTKIFSIDPRPLMVDDERGEKQKYVDNSTERMMRLLSEVAPGQLDKIVTIDAGAADIKPDSIKPKPDICFIDGEHTNAAALVDFEFCNAVLADDGVVVFHDSNLVYRGIQRIIAELRRTRVKHTPMKLGGTVLIIAFGNSAVASDPYIRSVTSSVRYYFLRSAVRLRVNRFKIKRKAKKTAN